MKRYFLITYMASNINQSITGNIWFMFEGFPSNIWMKEQAIKNTSYTDPVIVNIYEFSSEKDFNSFSKK